MNEDTQVDDSIENLLQDAPSQSFQEGTTSQLPRLTSTDAFTLLVSIQIGSGIFTSPGHVDRNVASPCLALLAWLIGGLLAWTGAASFAELGAALPSSGGMQEYLRYVYGDMVASSMALTWIFIVKPTAMAILSLLFVESLAASFEDAAADFSSTWIQRLASIAALLTVVFLNSISTVFTTRMSKSFVALKFITVGFILLGGLVVFSRHILFGVATPPNNTDWFTKSWIHARKDEPEWSEISTWEALGLFCAAIYGGLWAYSGWDNANYIASDMIDPARSLPRAIHAAMVVVIISFQLTLFSYYVLLPWKLLDTGDSVAVTAARSLLGLPGGYLLAGLVALSCAGALSGNVFVLSQLSRAAAEKGYLPNYSNHLSTMFNRFSFPSSRNRRGRSARERWSWEEISLKAFDSVGRWFRGARYSERYTQGDGQIEGSLLVADPPGENHKETSSYLGNVIAPSAISIILIVIGSFQALVTFIGIVEFSFFFLTVLGLLILRFREPSLNRPFRPHITIPLTFCLISGAIVVRSAILLPMQIMAFVTVLAVGLVYRYWATGRLR